MVGRGGEGLGGVKRGAVGGEGDETGAGLRRGGAVRRRLVGGEGRGDGGGGGDG